MSKVDEMLKFLEFSFNNNKNDKISILFKLFIDDYTKITRIISIKINRNNLSITNTNNGNHDCQIIIKEDVFVQLYSGGLSAFQLFKLLLRSKDIQTTNLSINKFRKFISKFDFSEKSWQLFYFDEQ